MYFCKTFFQEKLIKIMIIIQYCIYYIIYEYTFFSDVANRGDKKFGDRCIYNDECGFEGGICDERMMKCQCRPDLPITNHLDKCGTGMFNNIY